MTDLAGEEYLCLENLFGTFQSITCMLCVIIDMRYDAKSEQR